MSISQYNKYDFKHNINIPISDTLTDSISNPDDLVEGEAELLARFAPGTLEPLPTRKTLVYRCKQFVKELELLKGLSSSYLFLDLWEISKFMRDFLLWQLFFSFIA